ncbi:hypothetical protein [Desulfovibrio litoralis]|uniref:Uncharacterized protein n=1 Tax=Desulfovibrio litoralis DSM 11393 TaxID=1121455 RepID=A0A1M7SEX6_9BACT|nr:hypothetical protein [Desulfovibrio litoralis]SHN57041.1 hypothetical protein SAMN02745728_00863 [Desulfovibrio litoralis DSM 11393]
MLLADFNHVLLLSERESLCSTERYSLRQLGVSFIQSCNLGQKALEIIKENSKKKNFNKLQEQNKRYKNRLENINNLAGEEAALKWRQNQSFLNSAENDCSLYPVDLIVCTERLSDGHILDFLETLRQMPEQENIAVLVLPDSTRCWRESENLMACCLSRPYTLNEFHSKLLRAKYLLQTVVKERIANKKFVQIGYSLDFKVKQSLSQKQTAQPNNKETDFTEKRLTSDNYLGLAKPEPEKREPFPLLDEDFIELVPHFKRESFSLVDDFDDDRYEKFTRLRQRSFPLVDDEQEYSSNINVLRAIKTVVPQVEKEPANISAALKQPSVPNQTTQNNLYSLNTAQDLLRRGFYINAAHAFLSCHEIIIHNKRVEQVVYASCQYTVAPKDNLTKMVEAMQLVGEKHISQKLEKLLHKTYGLSHAKNKNSLMKKFPILSDILSVASMTVSVWRSPGEFSEYSSI